jgi:iron-sulfur cluster repair protein YtfE (RIC family)
MKDQDFNELCRLAKEITGIEVRYTRSRKKEFVQIRCAIVNVMRRYYSASTVQLGRLLDMHHTTIIHHSKDHSSRYRFEDDYASLYDKLVRHAMEKSDTISVDKMVSLMKSALVV